MSKNFNNAIEERRSCYGISKNVQISNDKIKKIVEEAVKYSPSAFNSQSARTVLLLGEHHDKLWSIVKETLRKVVPVDKFGPTEDKINSFAAGYGTVLYFDDKNVVKGLQEQFPLYKDNFPTWAQQSNGMLQLVLWTMLENEGLGASLQHYNPLIDDEVKKQWGIDESWQLIAQMPFGKPTEKPGEKQFQPMEERTKFFE